jgi:hypothetical protein
VMTYEYDDEDLAALIGAKPRPSPVTHRDSLPTHWTTREGERIPIAEMSNRHLLNARRMMERGGFVGVSTIAAYLFGPGPNGDAAQEAFDSELSQLAGAPISPLVDALDLEIKRRCLKIREV